MWMDHILVLDWIGLGSRSEGHAAMASARTAVREQLMMDFVGSIAARARIRKAPRNIASWDLVIWMRIIMSPIHWVAANTTTRNPIYSVCVPPALSSGK